MRTNAERRGFTLIEVIIAVALVAIMAVAIAPPLVQNIKNGKVTRAQSDAQTIGTAILSFYKDVGDWPTAGVSGGYLARLVGNSAQGGGNNGIPAGSGTVSGSSNWRDFGQAGTMAEYLIRNKTTGGTPLYSVSRNPMSEPGWNGPYLAEITTDPWGSPYMVNIRYARPPMSGTSTEDFDKHNLLVLSAGPNKRFETEFTDSSFDERAGGDDIAFIINRASRY
jgi:prepilin-type N-terminal cleavage/methylation domain-containing protein